MLEMALDMMRPIIDPPSSQAWIVDEVQECILKLKFITKKLNVGWVGFV